MPTLMETLNQDKQNIARKIIHNLLALETQALAYSEDINGFKARLSASISVEDFFAVVQQIIAKGREVYATLLLATNGMDDEISKAIDEYISNDDKLIGVMDALHFNASLSDSIIVTKERLSEHSLLSGLPAAQKAIVEKFINRVKELKIFADLLVSQKKVFIQRLSNTISLSELDDIEEEIEEQDKVIQSLYADTVTYPEDESTAGALIKYLETNQQILAIMKTFNFYESLADDILAARAKIMSTSSPRR